MTKLVARPSIRSSRPWLLGEGATTAERALVAATTVLGTLGVLALAWHAGTTWQWWQWLVVAVLAVDLLGGAAANALGASKRFYHRPLSEPAGVVERFLHHPVGFTAAHVQPFVLVLALQVDARTHARADERTVAWADASGGASVSVWGWALALYMTVLAAVIVVHLAPLYLKRPAAFAVATALLIGFTAVGHPTGLAWFAPVLAVKLVLAHAVPERAYRRGDSATEAVA
ncbi:hypothetical protein GCM10023169_38780 [Georgenia halophila]|uniref:Uncharacterized protein n=1 Tax=Georgenia halophila TaxID=620889 RepID=A0ABP8LPK5_9MICO